MFEQKEKGVTTMFQSDIISSILDKAKIQYFTSEPTPENQTEAIIIPLFAWKQDHAGIVIDCDPEDKIDVFVTGFIPVSMISDMAGEELRQSVNEDNVRNAGVQAYIENDTVYVRKTIDVSEGIFPRIVINAIYDVKDTIYRYRKEARERGNFPVDKPSLDLPDMPT